uniref:Uncharacterized protein n=1 Tax=Anguilla anguilla TaxID=7936 RepID=A0A0E9UKA2_ANGAN
MLLITHSVCSPAFIVSLYFKYILYTCPLTKRYHRVLASVVHPSFVQLFCL